MTLGDRIKKIRKEFDLTQEAFASRIGSVQNTITGYESGRRNPSAPVISLICREFGVNEEWLRDGVGEMLIPSNELEALAEKYHLSDADRILIEKYVGLKPEARAAVLQFMTDVAASLNEPDGSYSDIPATPEELERKFPPLNDEDKKGGLG